MTAFKESSSVCSSRLSRRALLGGIAGLFAGLALDAPRTALAQADGPGTRHMRAISKELLAAARTGAYEDFLRAVTRHADIREIADYSLGSYLDKLSSPLAQRYRRGVTGFMARYFSIEARKYNVRDGEVTGETVKENGEVVVHSTIVLASGSTYRVNWLLKPAGQRFKIRDVQILGFWLTWFQKRMFVNFIDKNGGDLKALLAALRV